MTDTQQDPGKGRPTPTRKEREAANRRPIVVADRKAAKAADRETQREERAKANAGYAAGDERYLPARDKGEQKRYVRDFVDARLSFGEFVIPAMFVAIVVMYINVPAVQGYVTYALLAYLVLAAVDAFLLGQRLQKRMNERYGDRAERVRMYAAMRCLQMRFMRMPKPQTKRFQFPE